MHKLQKGIVDRCSLTTGLEDFGDSTELFEQYPERRDELMQGLKRNASRLQRLSNDILDVTRIESQTLNLVKERVNVNETILNVINDVKNQIHKPDKLKMDFSEPKELVYIEADKIRIYQVIANLLTNALKFTEEGTISISVDVKDDNDELVISVMGIGLGINSDILPRLFTKFATRSDVGTGLGLYISKSIVEAHGGRIWAENNSNARGATFTFTLPLTIAH